MKQDNIRACLQVGYDRFQLDIDISLPGSGISVLFGESGSGKTTLLRCMAGLEQAKTGYFAVNGQVWQDSDKRLFIRPHHRNLGYVFQEANLFPHLTVQGNLEFGLKRIGKDNTGQDFTVIINLLGINNLLGRMPDRLSGGEKQRVAIARALVLNPDILLMDEPLASLDDKRKQEVLPYLLKLQQTLAIPIVYVTHSRQEVMHLADYLVVMANGKVQAAGALTDMLGRLDSPLAHEREAASVWQGEVIGRDDDFQLTDVRFNGVTLSLPNIDKPITSRARVQIHARDVSLALGQAKQTSILNVLPATVTGLADDKGGHTIVKLQCGGEILLSHITRKSAQLLDLQVGMAVFVQIKGTSLLI